ncbi:MAG TPA: PHP domain-containing protein [Bellilinea sp.]|nr:PHP domain-containing protein [Bellilinea sp.]
MKSFRAELHVHTVLSPCAELEMQPPLIIAEAVQQAIQILAITDHNASANIPAVIQAAQGSSITVFPGMEVQTLEEVHCLCLFDTLEQIQAWQKIVDQSLPEIKNQPDYFGDQLIVDQNGDFLAREERLLLTSTNLTINQAWQQVTQLGGLFIPAHVDRRANGLLALLGLVPTDIPLVALEISRNLSLVDAPHQYPAISGYPLLRGGDAHQLENITGFNHFYLDQPSIQELSWALSGNNGRFLQVSD